MPPNNNLADKLPKELIKEHKNSRTGFPVIEGLKMAAMLKLWCDRGFIDIKLNVPLSHEGKRFFVKVLAQNEEGKMFGVECASAISLGRLRFRVERLRACLPSDSYIIAVFPSTDGKKANKTVKFVNEVWVTGKDGTLNERMFMSSLGME
ncbi:MAG: hypothetical protein ACFCUE_11990 [Candidatus Bathyarchaeia archaeon]|jgi:hypothetical protein